MPPSEARSFETPFEGLLEAMYGEPDMDVALFVHERARDETAHSMRIAGVFTDRQMIDDDLEVIPHRATRQARLLTCGTAASTASFFTGDFVWIEDGEWKAVVLDAACK